MEKVKIYCAGCGVELQNENPSMTGYTPKLINKNGVTLCQRCYRLQHYGELKPEGLLNPDYKKILAKAIKRKNLIVYVIDLFNFEGSIIKEAHDLIKDNPVVVIANKRDILPKSCNDERLRKFVIDQMHSYGLNPIEVMVTSAKKTNNFDDWIKAAAAYRNGKDIYLIGASSSGKSSLINTFMHYYKNETRNLISTSPYPGTTVSTITIPLDNRSSIYDTPGIYISDSMYFKVENAALKRIIPKTEIKPQTFQLNKGQALLLGGLARLEYVEGEKCGFTVYTSNEVEIERTKLDKAQKTFDSLVSSGKIQPVSSTITGSESLDSYEFILPEKDVDIVIFGYLWINIKGHGQKIVLKAPRGIGVCVRDAII